MKSITLNKEYKKLDILITFLVVLCSRIFLSLKAFPIVYVSDEVSAISVAANLSGNNWNDVVVNAGYYGFGFWFLFAPLFKLSLSPITVYRFMLCILSVISALTAPICYLLIDKIGNNIKRSKKIIFAVLCSLLNILSTAVLNTRNEEVYSFLVWMMTYCIFIIIYEKEEKKVKQFKLFFFVILGYSYTIHARAVTILIAVYFITALLWILKKQIWISGRAAILLLVEYLIVNWACKLYQETIWCGDVRNASVINTLETSFSRIYSIDLQLIENFLKIVIGQIYTATVFTGGLFLVAFIGMIYYIVQFVYEKEMDEKDSQLAIIGMFFLICVLTMIGGMALSWLSGVNNATAKGMPHVYDTAYRAFTYMRYMGVYVPPFVMCSILVFERKWQVIKNSVYISGLLLGFISLFWMEKILVYIDTTIDIYFMTLNGMKVKEEVDSDSWLCASILIFSFWLMWLLATKCKKKNFIYISLIILLLFERTYIFFNSTYIAEKEIYMRANAGYEFLKELQKEEEIPEIYVYDASARTDHQIFFLYQFFNSSIHVIPQLPDKNEKYLLFSNADISSELEGNHLYMQLDENEFVYCNDEEYIECLERIKNDYIISLKGITDEKMD